jgi:peptidyl-prolyl cis-trans isomerase C
VRQAIIFPIVVFLFSIFSFGCDKIGFLNPKKLSVSKNKAEPAAGVAVKGTLIAKVNNIPITLEELNRYIDIYNASMDLRQDLTPEQKKVAKIDTREKKLDYLKNILIRQAVFYQAALDRGLDRKEDIVDVLRRYKIAVLAQEMQNEIVKNLDVSSAEIEEAYKNNKSLFREPESRRIREVVTKTEDEAKQILIQLLQGQDFISIAKTSSIAESAKNGGDLGLMKRGQRGDHFANFDEIVFSPALTAGAISSVFKGPDGYYYMVKVEEIKEGKEVSLSEAWDTIKTFLLVRKQQEELDKIYSKLSSESKIETYEGEIK